MFYAVFVLLSCLSVAYLLFKSSDPERQNGRNRSETDNRRGKKSTGNNRKRKSSSGDKISSAKGKYKGYISGRDKRAKVPEKGFAEKLTELDEDERQKLKDYLGIRAPSPDNLDYVYACPNCHVRITHMSDMVRTPIIWNECREIDMNAVFKWTTNLTEKKGTVHCYRCDHDFGFSYRPDDRQILTLPMLDKGFKHRFLKREFRLLCIAYAESFVSFTCNMRQEPEEKWKDLDFLKNARISKEGSDADVLERISNFLGRISAGKAIRVEKVYTTSAKNQNDYEHFIQQKKKREKIYGARSRPTPEGRFNGKTNGLRNKLGYDFGPNVDTYDEKLRLLNLAHQDLGFKFCFWRDLENISETKVCDVNTYDMSLYFKLTYDGHPAHDEFSTIQTDVGAARHGTEKVHLVSWALSGGNFLFGTFGDNHRTSEDCDNADMLFEAQDWMGYDPLCRRDKAYIKRGSNMQIGFSKLIRDGHWLGKWKFSCDPSEMMQAKMKKALVGKQLFPQWLFLNDYPETVMGPTLRWKNGENVTTKVEDVIPYFFYDKAKELYSPKFFVPVESVDLETIKTINGDVEIKWKKSKNEISLFGYGFSRAPFSRHISKPSL